MEIRYHNQLIAGKKKQKIGRIQTDFECHSGIHRHQRNCLVSHGQIASANVSSSLFGICAYRLNQPVIFFTFRTFLTEFGHHDFVKIMTCIMKYAPLP